MKISAHCFFSLDLTNNSEGIQNTPKKPPHLKLVEPPGATSSTSTLRDISPI